MTMIRGSYTEIPIVEYSKMVFSSILQQVFCHQGLINPVNVCLNFFFDGDSREIVKN